MKPKLNLSNEEKIKIGEWKESLPPIDPERIFIHVFMPTGKLTPNGYLLYNYVIKTDDGFSKIISENIELN